MFLSSVGGMCIGEIRLIVLLPMAAPVMVVVRVVYALLRMVSTNVLVVVTVLVTVAKLVLTGAATLSVFGTGVNPNVVLILLDIAVGCFCSMVEGLAGSVGMKLTNLKCGCFLV